MRGKIHMFDFVVPVASDGECRHIGEVCHWFETARASETALAHALQYRTLL